MPFTKQLNPRLVSELNALYTDKGSWWRTLVDDKDIFVSIRPNGISAYAYGASVAKIEWNGRLCLTVHRQFLVARKKVNGGEYVDLGPPNLGQREVTPALRRDTDSGTNPNRIQARRVISHDDGYPRPEFGQS